MKKPLLPWLLLASPAFAAEPAAPAIDRVLACADIPSALARLDCFDRESRALAPAQPAPAVVVTPPSAPPALGDEQLKPKDRPRETTAPSELHARIETLRNSSGGVYFITLDNGQVWQHESGSMAGYLTKGAAVTISKASMGSYRLTLDEGSSKNWIRVSRVR